MNYLAIDTSGSYLTVAASGEKKCVIYKEDCQLSHSAIVMDAIENSLFNAGIKLSEADIIACALGPGSFTGIRIGISTAKALAYAENKKVLGVTTFESFAYNVNDEREKLVAIDANHGNFYICAFSADNKVIMPPRFTTESEVVDLSKDYCVITDGTLPVPFVKADPSKGFISAVEAKLTEATIERESLVPLYVKKSQAEEESCK